MGVINGACKSICHIAQFLFFSFKLAFKALFMRRVGGFLTVTQSQRLVKHRIPLGVLQPERAIGTRKRRVATTKKVTSFDFINI